MVTQKLARCSYILFLACFNAKQIQREGRNLLNLRYANGNRLKWHSPCLRFPRSPFPWVALLSMTGLAQSPAGFAAAAKWMDLNSRWDRRYLAQVHSRCSQPSSPPVCDLKEHTSIRLQKLDKAIPPEKLPCILDFARSRDQRQCSEFSSSIDFNSSNMGICMS